MRHYKHKGKKLVSVTTVIDDCTNKSGALTQWAANMVVEWIKTNCDGEERKNKLTDEINMIYSVSEEELNEARFNFKDVSDKALDVGSQVHGAIEKFFLGDSIPELKDQALVAYNAFIQFKEEHNIKVIEAEQKVYSDCWAGTLDFRGYYDGKLYIIDFKSSKGIYMESMGPQIAAYASRVEHEGSGILRLDKETGLPEFKDTTKLEEKYLKIFNNMVALFFSKHPKIAKDAGWEG